MQSCALQFCEPLDNTIGEYFDAVHAPSSHPTGRGDRESFSRTWYRRVPVHLRRILLLNTVCEELTVGLQVYVCCMLAFDNLLTTTRL